MNASAVGKRTRSGQVSTGTSGSGGGPHGYSFFDTNTLPITNAQSSSIGAVVLLLAVPVVSSGSPVEVGSVALVDDVVVESSPVVVLSGAVVPLVSAVSLSVPGSLPLSVHPGSARTIVKQAKY